MLFGKTLGSAGDGKSQQLASDPPAAKRVVVQAAGRGNPYINFEEGVELSASYEGAPEIQSLLKQNAAEPRALASADFDEDGVPDLICGYSRPEDGIITIYRGNVDSIYQNSLEARRRKAEGTFTDSAFLSPARVFEAPIAADFVGAGDFDADGHWDVVIAARRCKELYLLPGDGKGGFLSARKIGLPGAVTSLITGEINRADGLTDVVVGVVADDGPQVLVFEGPDGALNAKPEVFYLPGEPRALALGQFDDDYSMDLAVGAGSELVIIHGRDRKLSLDEIRQGEAPTARLDQCSFGFEIRSISTGDFGGANATSLALLAADGTVYLTGTQTHEQSQQAAKKRGATDAEVIGQWRGATQLVCARVSTGPSDDLLMLDPDLHELNILKRGGSRDWASSRSSRSAAVEASTCLNIDGEPLAVLPMRLNGDALSDLVVLQAGRSAPSVVKTVTAMTFVVNKTDDHDDGICDSADCTLREAINAANLNAGADLITFSGVSAVMPLTQLPTISDAVTIDGTTLSGSRVQLTGFNIDQFTTSGLDVTSGSSTIRGLAIDSFHWGPRGDGMSLRINGHNFVENNVILGNNGSAVFIDGSPNNMIGGTTPGARNVLSGNSTSGVETLGSASMGNQVQGNYIGTDETGTMIQRNSFAGVFLREGPINNTVGGTIPGSGNVISGNNSNGLLIGRFVGDGTAANRIQGNFIGTNASGTAALANDAAGVAIVGPSNLIGGTTPGARNLISGNVGAGVQIAGSMNQVQGNAIGTASSTTFALPNSGGVSLDGSNNLIGGLSSGAGNVIAFNTTNGVRIGGGVANSILGNSVFSNVLLGIDLGSDGVTPADPCDGDSGANNLQNFPVLSSAAPNGTSTTIQGALNSLPNTTFTVEFFSNTACDPSGFGQGQSFIGLATVTTGADCVVTFNITLPVSVAIGRFITATATDSAGNTSEFSVCLQVTCGYALSPSTAFFAMNGGAGSVNVFAGSSACAWFAAATENWITIVSPDNGTGNGAVDFEVRENFTGSARQGNIKIADQLFTIIQDGGLGDDCQYSISPMFQSFPASGGNGSVNIFAAERCAWQAVNNANWIAITAGQCWDRKWNC